MTKSAALRRHVLALLDGQDAHLNFEATFARFPAKLRGVKPKGAAHSAWQLLEHMRIAQWDILEFSHDPNHVSPKFPEGYWPESDAPSPAQWNKSLNSFRADLKAMKNLVSDEKSDLFARIPHGTGQTLLREALLLADHNAYHLGQVLLLRRVLGDWKE